MIGEADEEYDRGCYSPGINYLFDKLNACSSPPLTMSSPKRRSYVATLNCEAQGLRKSQQQPL